MPVELNWHDRAMTLTLVQRVGKLETILLDLMIRKAFVWIYQNT